MADRLNNARSMRIIEIMADFRSIQHNITAHATNAASNPSNPALQALAGYQLIRRCHADAQSVFPPQQNVPAGNVVDQEAQRRLLIRVIEDAFVRRFRAHRIYLRIACAIRWVMLRSQVPASSPNAQAAFQRIDQTLRQEMASITDQHVYTSLRTSDQNQNRYMDDDPSFARVLQLAQVQQ